VGIQMLDPIAPSVVIEQPAPARLTTLDGKVVGLYTNTKLNATKVLEMAAEIAVVRGVMLDADRQALARLVMQLGPLPPVGDLSTHEVLDAVKRDKKIVDGRLRFVLCTGIGSWTTVDDVGEDELGRALREVGLQN